MQRLMCLLNFTLLAALSSMFISVPVMGFPDLKGLITQENISSWDNLKNIFVSPYSTLFYRHGSVGRFYNFSNWILIKLNCIQ